MLPIDRFMLHRIGELSAELRVAFESFRFQGAINGPAHPCTTREHCAHSRAGLAEFINMYLNKFYFEIVKDRLYLDLPSATTRRSAQTAMEATLRLLIAALAPVAPHLADELHGFHSGINPTVRRPRPQLQSPSAHRTHPRLSDSIRACSPDGPRCQRSGTIRLGQHAGRLCALSDGRQIVRWKRCAACGILSLCVPSRLTPTPGAANWGGQHRSGCRDYHRSAGCRDSGAVPSA